MEKVPLTDFVPLHEPEATQEVAFVLLQVSVEPLFLSSLMIVGFAVSVTVGTRPTLTWAEVLEPGTLPGNPLLQVST